MGTQLASYTVSTPTCNGNGKGNGHTEPVVITGRGRAPRTDSYTIARKRSASQRAAIAAAIILGETTLDRPSRQQVARLLHVSLTYVNHALTLSTGQRMLMSLGHLELAQFPKPPTDTQLTRTVRAAGVNRVWKALEPLI
jgi:hypothetical protein